MTTGPLRLRLFLALVVAFVLQAAFGSAWSFRGARPDVALVTMLMSCLFVGPRTAAGLGFTLGLLQASWPVSQHVGSFIVSRTLAAWSVGMLEQVIFRDSLFMAVTIAIAGTLAVEGSFFIFAPQPHAMRWLIRTAIQAACNGAVAIPVYYLLRRFIRPPSAR